MTTKLAILALLAALVGLPTRAAAHAHLVKSNPAANDTVRGRLSTLRLTFTEAVEARYTSLVLVDATGREYPTIGPSAESGASREFEFSLSRALSPGRYEVRWRAAGSDGHAVTGTYIVFVVAPAGATASQVKTAAPISEHHAAPSTIPPMFEPEKSPFWIATRGVNFTAIVLLIGVVVFRYGVLRRATPKIDAQTTAVALRRAGTIAVIASVLGLAANLARLVLQSGSLHSPAQMWDPHLVSAMLSKTTWGRAWLVQSLAMATIAVLFSVSRRSSTWVVGTICAIALAITAAFSGHANGMTNWHRLAVIDDAAHVIAASGWLGCLAVVLFAGLPATVSGSQPDADVAHLIGTFSTVALVMAGSAVLTGVISVVLRLPSLQLLWSSAYGKTLLVKLGIVPATAATGAYNWRVVTPRLGTCNGTAQLKKSAVAETLIAVAVIAITAVLVALPTP